MEKLFLHNIKQVKNYQSKKFLIAISGGLDSVVLSYLFKQAKLDFALAHCNFKLRGKESDADQQFVEKWANQLQIKSYVKICDLSDNVESNTQIAARNERYKWFDQLLQKHHFDYIVVGHHLDDSIETFFINLQRAAGLKGLTGISQKHKLLRPLLDFTRKEIEKYALGNKLVWREDSSNLSDKYQRNFIRHHIIPKFEELTPSFKMSMQKTLQYLQQSNEVVNDWVHQKTKEIVTQNDEIYQLSIDKIRALSQKELFLHHFFSDFGFSDFLAIKHLLSAQNGKTIFAQDYRLFKHQNMLILTQLPNETQSIFKIDQMGQFYQPFSFLMMKYDIGAIDLATIKNASKNEVYLDYDLIKFPLTLRKWQAGDYFYPFGMKGKMKLSDYFINQKISLLEKEKIWLFCNNENDIVWIAGKRPDNRFKITKHTNTILHIKMN